MEPTEVGHLIRYQRQIWEVCQQSKYWTSGFQIHSCPFLISQQKYEVSYGNHCEMLRVRPRSTYSKHFQGPEMVRKNGPRCSMVVKLGLSSTSLSSVSSSKTASQVSCKSASAAFLGNTKAWTRRGREAAWKMCLFYKRNCITLHCITLHYTPAYILPSCIPAYLHAYLPTLLYTYVATYLRSYLAT